MTKQPTTIDDHDPLAHDILRVMEDFIDEVGSRECTGHFDKVVDGKYYLKGKHLIQNPERFIEDHLVFPMLRQVFGYSLRPQPKQYAPRWPRGGGVPDFAITSVPVDAARKHDLRFFGEVKPPKKIENAQDDLKNYLDADLDIHAIAILTDGFDWQVWVRPKGEPTEELSNPRFDASLRDPLRKIQTRNMTNKSYSPHEVRDRINSDKFGNFRVEELMDVIETEFGVGTAPF